jgi:hypothetical protein
LNQELIVNSIKHLLTTTTAAIALWSAGISVAQMYGDGTLSLDRGDVRSLTDTKTNADVRAELLAERRAGRPSQ